MKAGIEKRLASLEAIEPTPEPGRPILTEEDFIEAVKAGETPNFSETSEPLLRRLHDVLSHERVASHERGGD